MTWIVGVNEAVTAPPALSADAQEAHLTADLRRAAAVRATVTRIQSGAWPRFADAIATGDYTIADAAMKRLGDAGLSVVVVLAPWPGNKPWTVVDDCAVDDAAAWTSGVAKLVERYDHDGVGDADGAAKVVAWEVDNEPDLHDTAHPGFCPPSAYAATLAATSAGVRAADPHATVLSGGIYRPQTSTGLAWMRALGADPRWTSAGVDGVAVHLYPSSADEPEDVVARAFANVRAAFGDVPVWVTEASTLGHGDGTGKRGEDEQARAMVALAKAVRDAGGQAFFWHTLHDLPGGEVPHAGLFEGDRPKAAAEAFQGLGAL